MRRKIIVFKPFRQICQKAKRQKKIMDKNRITSICIDSWCSSTVEDRLEYLRENVKQRTGRSLQTKAVPIRMANIQLNPLTGMQTLHRLHNAILASFGVEIFRMDLFDDNHALLVADWTNHETGLTLKLGRQELSNMQDVAAGILGIDRGQSLSDLEAKIIPLHKEIEALELVKSGKQSLLGLFGQSDKDRQIQALQKEIELLNSKIEESGKKEKDASVKILKLQEQVQGLHNIIRSKNVEIRSYENMLKEACKNPKK
ncbi:MAG: hypothetical protein J6M44_03235 [Butyrivibrio sp.]|nr:hypothetical protein [Butyrivibrio sp.]